MCKGHLNVCKNNTYTYMMKVKDILPLLFFYICQTTPEVNLSI